VSVVSRPLLHLRFSTALVLSAVVSLASGATIRWLPPERPVAVEVEGVVGALPRDATDPAWVKRLAVFAEQTGPGAVPPMAGTWRVLPGERLRFEPPFPLTRGVRYRAEYRVEGVAPLVSFFELPADVAPPSTTIVSVFPSAEVLPENQLKFYVHFSAPMSRGRTYEHVHLRDAAGRVIDLPFLEIDEELWDPTMTRLTLLIDPGRIKRGVKPLVDIGPVFEAGKAYSLTIGEACLDAEGRSLRAGYEKKFRIGPADRIAPDPSRWKIAPPTAATRAPLTVQFDEPMDHALASRMLRVATADGATVDGEVNLDEQEKRWRFVPDQSWRAGSHHLIVATTIEDLAGNNIGKAFDVDVFENVSRRIETPTVEVAFDVK
jgi:hypothetical protein